ncbi:unnamed protein product [Heligmosomoides polygyrus]|uniref:DUF5641 domain-containing protein n=1 Tax=Heligmosomoides polygyrus TaxID=6339 RepID=A0A183GIK5_HELPZ|nr:unnamed protein product [Heligmosomoides polygyrus]
MTVIRHDFAEEKPTERGKRARTASLSSLPVEVEVKATESLEWPLEKVAVTMRDDVDPSEVQKVVARPMRDSEDNTTIKALTGPSNSQWPSAREHA